MSGHQVLPYQSYLPLVRSLAKKILARMRAAGCASARLEDIEQEIAVTWCQARDGYDPSKGAAFSTYFVRAVWFNVNRWIDEEIGQHHLAPRSLDEPVGEEGDMVRHELVPDRAEPVDLALGNRERFARVLDRLSPMARRFVELLDSPPPALYRQLDALKARAEFGRSRGLPSQAPRHITASIVMRAMGVPIRERTVIYREINQVLAEVSQ
jgi:DNA-directed RNA polymerase specialized sigma24 family protein